MEGLFDGDDLDVDGESDTDALRGHLTAGDVSKLLDISAGTAGGTAAGQAGLLADLGSELEQLSGHGIIKNIMDQVGAGKHPSSTMQLSCFAGSLPSNTWGHGSWGITAWCRQQAAGGGRWSNQTAVSM
jgi:hypothetical protein